MTYDKNISKLLQDAEVFGLGWLGDGATIKWMPFLNILVLCGSASWAVVSIIDCTTHMSDGGKKDATYIMEQFWRKVDEIDVDGKASTNIKTGPMIQFKTKLTPSVFVSRKTAGNNR